MASIPRLLGRYLLLAVALISINFFLPRLLPGDPLTATSADGLSSAAPLPAAAEVELRSFYHLDQPLPAQFMAYLKDLGHGNLGWSISKSAPVSQLILERLPWTVALVLTSLVIAAAVGSVLGLAAAWKRGPLDRLLLSVSTSMAALPEFLVAMLLLLALAIALPWFPLSGGHSIFAPRGSGLSGLLSTGSDLLWHLALPAVALISVTMASFLVLARGAVLDVLAEPYVEVARAKGLPNWQVALRHAGPNAALPVVTLLGIRLGQALGGAMVVERVFGLPGIGLFAFEAIQARDYPVLQGIFLLTSLGVLTANLLLELSYRHLNPRLRGVG